MCVHFVCMQVRFVRMYEVLIIADSESKPQLRVGAFANVNCKQKILKFSYAKLHFF